jgi:hypothetical protein
VSWVEVFAVLLVSHLAGDFVVQTDWQATNKSGGLGGDRERRRALLTHILTYTLCYLPALVWLSGDVSGAGLAGVAALIALPHLVQDDGRLLSAYLVRVKRTRAAPGDLVYFGVDQSLHVLALFGVSLLVAV